MGKVKSIERGHSALMESRKVGPIWGQTGEGAAADDSTTEKAKMQKRNANKHRNQAM